MVLKVKDFTWSQDDENVFINIPLKGKKKTDVDITNTDSYLKVNFSPYIFETFLFEPIDDFRTKVIFVDGVLMFNLKKLNANRWSSLFDENIHGNKEITQNQRILELQKYELKVNTLEKEKSEKKNEGNKYSLKQMMQLEAREKERIKLEKEIETAKAMEELEQWKQSQHEFHSKNQLKQIKSHSEPIVENNENNSVEIFDKKEKCEPIIRKSGKIEISFTNRVFPTPERESVKQQEDEWLKKQLEIKQNNRIKVTDDMKPEENNPDWLKSKGNSFFMAGDYGAALAAYDMALDINPDLYECLSNRAACHIKMRNFYRAIDDCTRVLEQCLCPAVKENQAARIKAHLRRGAAYCNLEMFQQGILDYEAALKLDPDNRSIRTDIEQLKRL